MPDGREKDFYARYDAYSKDLRKKEYRVLKPFEEEPILGISTFRGTMGIVDERIPKLAGSMGHVNRLLSVRFVWGIGYTGADNYGTTAFLRLFNEGVGKLFNKPRWMDIRAFSFDDMKQKPFHELIDLFVKNPEVPITVVSSHGGTAKVSREHELQVLDPITERPVATGNIPFRLVRHEVERRDDILWEGKGNSGERPQSLIVLSSCNGDGLTLPDSKKSVVYYKKGFVGFFEEPSPVIRTRIV